jgi:hypothetical protein
MRARACTALLAALLAIAASSGARAEIPPDGWIVWESNRQDGRRDLYLMKADGSDVKRLTTGGARVPTWSPDGRWIAYEDYYDQSAHVMRWDGSEVKNLPGGKPAFWMHDNSGLVCREGDDINLVDPDAGTKKVMFKQSEFSAFSGKMFSIGGISHDGRWLIVGSDLYRNGFAGDNGSFTAGFAAVLLDLLDRKKVYFVGSGCGPTTPPTGDYVYHVCGADSVCPTYPDIYRMSLADIVSRASYAPEMAHPDADWGHEYHPRISTDGKWLVYAASQGCHDDEFCDYEIFVHKLGAGADNRTRVTFDGKNDQFPHLYVGPLWEKQSPRLKLVPSTLSFECAPGGAPPAQTVAVSNSGIGTLDAVTATVTFTDGQGWLAVTVGDAGNAQRLTVSAAATGLEAGRYAATIQVLAANASNSPQPLPVMLTVTGGDASVPVPDGGVGPKPGGGGCALAPLPAAPAPLSLALTLLALALRRR